ncbi:hypothetical protein [Dokdonella koreensis]|uniref:hypothetical protein n=1 Tax=Dokdonella koreensis TaxID=323415 RepID=UPI0012371CC1|nr:hypothetical protein [Dokdonella koreensis]
MADRRLVALLLAFLSCACLAGPAELEVNACIVSDEDGFILRFEVSNVSENSITIPNERLPWGVDGAIVVAYRGTAIRGGLLRRVYLIQDDFSENRLLRRGGKQYGDVYLSHIFPELRKPVAGSPVTVMWSYSVLDLPVRQETIGGALTLLERDRCAK